MQSSINDAKITQPYYECVLYDQLLAPVVKVIQENFGISHGCITTIHNVTGTQSIVDVPNTKKSDLRRARSGMMNLCPTSTGSATAIVEIYPELKGKLNGLAVRVPLLNGSITDCVFEVKQTVTAEQVNEALKKASESGPLKGILGYETKPLVSTDYTNDTCSSIIDALSTQVIDGTMIKLYAWYDNEAGYSKRMAELCNIAGDQT
jgi:glyceraldehyde 3-phosphate dehydrogenase